MRTYFNAVLVVFLSLVLMGGIGSRLRRSGGEAEDADSILSTDSGSATRDKYLAAYEANLKQAASDFAVRLEADEFPDSYAAVKAWSEMARGAGAGAAKGVDLRIAELVKQDRETQVAWIKDFAR